MPALGGNARKMFGGTDIWSIAVSPDGKQVAYRRNDRFYLAAIDGSVEKELITWKEMNAVYFNRYNSVDWSPDGGKLVLTYANDKKEVNRQDVIAVLDLNKVAGKNLSYIALSSRTRLD